ncbi:MAG: hypothetical protein OHK0029_35520 [Armatimonadaceae bacterium]
MLILSPRPLSVLMALLSVLLVSPAFAQVAFEKTMADFAKDYRVTIVTESQPLQLDLPEDKFAGIQAEMSKAETTAQRLAILADAFDYAVKADPAFPTLFVLHKQYNNPEDLPDVTFEEGRLAVKNIRKATLPYEPNTSSGPVLWKIYHSLNPAEQAQLSAPEGVPVSLLTPAQRQNLIGVVNTAYFFHLSVWTIMEERLDGCRSPKAQFGQREFFGVNLPYYEGPLKELQHLNWTVVLNSRVFTQSLGGTTVSAAKNDAELIDDKLVMKTPDPTAPNAKPTNSPTFRLVALPLKDAVCRIEARMPDAGSAVRKAFVDAPLETKKVCLFGEGFTAAEKILEGLAAVYGLRVVHPDDQTARITMQAVRPQEIAPAEVKGEVYRLLPLPIAHIFQKAKARPAFVTAIRELRTLVEPELAKREGGVLLLSQADPRARDLIAISSLLTCETDVFRLTDQSKHLALLTNFGQARIRVAYEMSKENPDKVRIQYALKTSVPGTEKPMSASIGATTTVPLKRLNEALSTVQ